MDTSTLTGPGHTPNAGLPPLDPSALKRTMLVEIEVAHDFEKRLDNQWMVEREIHADRWNWRWAETVGDKPVANVAAGATASEDWRSIAVYRDGSGKAGEYYDQAIKTIEEWEAVHRLHRAFLTKHAETLAGCYWRVAYLEAAIEIQYGMYRGKHTTPADIAMLWPSARWKRVKDKYTSQIRYSWEAVVDGITLRIERAESEEPRPKLRDGELIRLPKE